MDQLYYWTLFSRTEYSTQIVYKIYFNKNFTKRFYQICKTSQKLMSLTKYPKSWLVKEWKLNQNMRLRKIWEKLRQLLAPQLSNHLVLNKVYCQRLKKREKSGKWLISLVKVKIILYLKLHFILSLPNHRRSYWPSNAHYVIEFSQSLSLWVATSPKHTQAQVIHMQERLRFVIPE